MALQAVSLVVTLVYVLDVYTCLLCSKILFAWANAGVADVTARTLAPTKVNVNVATTQNTDTFVYIKSDVIIHPLLG
jgi:hypothetical protein